MTLKTLKVLGHDILPSHYPLLGEGGTAWVYDIGSLIPKRVLKVMKPPEHYPRGFEREQAKDRLNELKERLESFPKLPPNVAGPEGIVLHNGGVAAVVLRKVEGFILSQLYDYEWRVRHRFDNKKVELIFTHLANTWRALHAEGIVIGDVKPENVIVEKGIPILIDTEGLQFGKFRGRGFTLSCVDPLIVTRSKDGEIRTTSAFSTSTDWFGFNVMCFNALTFLGPYDGVYWKSKGGGVDLDDFERRVQGVSVYHPAVKVPKFARLHKLCDELTEYFQPIFAHTSRKPFPVHVFEPGWSRIPTCTFHAVRGGISSSAQL
jgi:DNA-binding helix-hairpin-helix protein with protein kinase domain